MLYWLLWMSMFIYSLDGMVNNDHQVYSGHQIWKVEGDAPTMMSRFQYLSDHHSLDVLGSDGQVRIKQEQLDHVHKDLLNHGLTYEVIVHDLQEHLQYYDKHSRNRRQVKKDCSHPLNNAWMDLEEMECYLTYINKTHYPWIEVTSIGKSIQNRDIWMVHFKAKNFNSTTKATWIEGGVHAREWISPAMALHIIDMLVDEQKLSQDQEHYIVPMANPDGYKYSYTEERLWRKNLRDNDGSSCLGVDLNRNWDYQFGIGASSNPCSETYKGTGPFSEPETLALSNRMKVIPNLTLVLSLHSYGQTLLYPWGYSSKIAAPDTEWMIKLGEDFKRAVYKVNNNDYTIMLSSSMYPASGATDDWAKGKLKATYAYTLELPTKSSFIIPAADISKYSKETCEGVKAMFENI